MCVRVSLCTPPFGLSFEEDEKHSTLSHSCPATGRPELVFCFVFKTNAGIFDVVHYCDCRHVYDDGESHHEDLDEGDLDHEDHDSLGSASVTDDCPVMFSHVDGVLRSLLQGCTTLCLLVSVARPFFRRSDVKLFFICYSVKFLEVGLRVFFVWCMRCSSSTYRSMIVPQCGFCAEPK